MVAKTNTKPSQTFMRFSQCKITLKYLPGIYLHQPYTQLQKDGHLIVLFKAEQKKYI